MDNRKTTSGDMFSLEPGPARVDDPVVRDAIKRAAVWLSMAAALWIAWRLAQPILLIIAGIVFAALLDGGTRLLGRVLPIGRAWRLMIVGLAAPSAIVGTGYWLGVEIVHQAGELRETVNAQVQCTMSWHCVEGIMTSRK